MNYEQKLSHFWWTGNIRYLIYFLREFTGVLIALYTIFFLAQAIFDPTLSFVKEYSFRIVSWIGLAAAIFHTITWFWVTVKISPIPLKKPLQVFFFLILIILWLTFSYFLLHFFYVS
jgi:fumarate reductase subunit C